MSIHILLVDDHTMFRQALRVVLEGESDIQVVGEIGDGAQVEEAVAQLQPDVVLMDVSLPNVNGVEATRRVLARSPAVRIVALSAVGYKQVIREMLGYGAAGFVLKSAAGEQLIQAIRSVMAGQSYLCPETLAVLGLAAGASIDAGAARSSHLGRREMQVLGLIAAGRSSPEIANELHIATSTVDVHRRNIMTKLELHSVAELTAYAIRLGLA